MTVGPFPRSVESAVFIHNEFLHVGLLAVGVGDHDVIAAREGGGSGSGGLGGRGLRELVNVDLLAAACKHRRHHGDNQQKGNDFTCVFH